MPDETAEVDVVAQAQEMGADILAKLDELTQKPTPAESAPTAEALERRRKLAKQAVEKMYSVVADYLAEVQTEMASDEKLKAAAAEQEIDRIKAEIGAQ